MCHKIMLWSSRPFSRLPNPTIAERQQYLLFAARNRVDSATRLVRLTETLVQIGWVTKLVNSGAPTFYCRRNIRTYSHVVPPYASTSRRWKGLPENAARSGLSALQREKEDRERSLELKKGQLADLLVQQISFRNLARRNRSNAAARATAAAVAAAASAGNGAECAGDEDAEEVAASKVKGGRLVSCVFQYFVPGAEWAWRRRAKKTATNDWLHTCKRCVVDTILSRRQGVIEEYCFTAKGPA